MVERLVLRVAWVRQTSNTSTETLLEDGYQKCQRLESEMSYRSHINSEPACAPDVHRADDFALQKGTALLHEHLAKLEVQSGFHEFDVLMVAIQVYKQSSRQFVESAICMSFAMGNLSDGVS